MYPRTFLLALVCALCANAVRGAPGDGLPGSPHDFRRAIDESAAGRGNLCSACHVPRSTSSIRMLWAESVERDNASHHARDVKDTYSGPSARCLSCHDGTVANGDGGGYRDDHPVPMPYPYRNVASTYNGVRNAGLLAVNEWIADPTSRNIRLYSEDSRGNVVGGPRFGTSGIECSSCHDAHNKAAKDRHFLRGSVSGERISLRAMPRPRLMRRRIEPRVRLH